MRPVAMGPWLTLPNVLTVARLGLAPWIGLAIARRDYETALPVLVAAGVSDALDGYLARRFHSRTQLGARLDPAADKALAAAVFLALAWNGGVPVWMAGLVFGRDLLILGFAGWALWRGIAAELAPTIWGKLSTLLQLSLAVAVVLRQGFGAGWVAPLIPALLWAAAGMTIWSGLHYARLGWKLVCGREYSID